MEKKKYSGALHLLTLLLSLIYKYYGALYLYLCFKLKVAIFWEYWTFVKKAKQQSCVIFTLQPHNYSEEHPSEIRNILRGLLSDFRFLMMLCQELLEMYILSMKDHCLS